MPDTAFGTALDVTAGRTTGRGVLNVVAPPVPPAAEQSVSGNPARSAMATASPGTSDLSSPTDNGFVSSAPPPKSGKSKLPIVSVLIVLAVLSLGFLALALRLAHLNRNLSEQQQQISKLKTGNIVGGSEVSLTQIEGAIKDLQNSGELKLQGPAGKDGSSTGVRGSRGSAGATGAAGAVGANGSNGSANCGNGSCVSLQGSTPGTQESGNVNVAGSGLFGGRVGIGTQNPDANLNIVGTIDTTDSNTVANPTIRTLANQGGSEGSYGLEMTKGADGLPRIAYFDYDNYKVVYIRCSDASCSSKISQVIDDATYGYYHSVDITIGSDGFARIIYEDYNDNSLKLARCTDADCTSPVLTTVDAANSSPGSYGNAILMGQDDKPRIAADDGIGTMRFYRCTDADCTSPIVTDIDSNSYNYGNIGFAIGSDGFARISYNDNDTSTVQLARCTDADCSSPVITSVGSNNNTQYGLDLQLASDGFPRLAYFSQNNYFVNYAVCDDADCTAPTITEISEIYEEGYYIGLALDSNDVAHIIAEDSSSDNPLLLVNCSNEDCSGRSVVKIDSDAPNDHYYGYYATPIFIGTDNYVNIVYDDGGYGNGLHFARYSLTPLDAPTPPTDALHVVGNSKLGGKVTTGNLVPLTTTGKTRIEDRNDEYGISTVLGDDGFARIAYSGYIGENGDEGFNFYRCLNSDCSSYNRSHISDSYIYFPSMVKAPNGDFLITYYSSDFGGLRLVHCTNEDCTIHTITDLDNSDGNGGYYGSVIKIGSDGFPRIAYSDYGSDYEIKYMKCSSLDCTGSVPVTVDTPDGVYVYNSLELDMALGSDDKARIVYTNDDDDALMLARCTSADCSTAVTTVVNGNSSNYGFADYGVQILLASDNTPRIAYQDGNDYEVWYSKCTDLDCNIVSNLKTVQHDSDNYGNFGFVLAPDGTARIVYEDDDNAYQYLLTCTNIECSNYTTKLFDSSESYQSEYGSSMAMDADGSLYIVYTGSGDGYLHYVRIPPGGQSTSVGTSSAYFGQAYVEGVNLQDGAILSGAGKMLQVTTDNPGSFAASFTNEGGSAESHGLSVQAGWYNSGFTYYLRAQTNYNGSYSTIGYLANNNGTFGVTDVSDIRTKTNIEDTTLQGLDVINGLNVVDFNRITNPDGPRITGFIAQDVQGVYPQAVNQDPDGLLGINKDAFIPVLVKAVQEQQAQIAAIQQQLQSGGVSNEGAQLSNLSVTTLTVQDLVVTASLKVNGHIITGNKSGATSVVAEAGANCGGTATVSLSGNDTSGTVTITTPGGSCVAGDLVTVSFADAYSAVPHVLLTPVGAASAALQAYVGQTATNFTIGTAGTPAGGTTYSYNYQIMQ